MATVTKPIALDESLNTTELSSRNVADVLAQELSAVATAIGGIAVPSADHVSYDNSGSGLSATDVQNALDEIVSDIPTVNNGTLTIQQNGTSIGSFSANTASNVTANIKTPTADKKTATGEFSTADGGLLSKCLIDLVPVQSGSGDPSPDNVRPISGHTEVDLYNVGKNKCPNRMLTNTRNGITATKNDDGTCTFNGTATALTDFYMTIPNGVSGTGVYIPDDTYTFSGISGGSNTTYRLYVSVDSSPVTYYGINSDKANFSSNGYAVNMFLRVYSGAVLNNVVIKPMICLASDPNPTVFEPYLGHLYQVQIGSTVYGGYVDLVSGGMNVDKAYVELDGSVDESWSVSSDRFRFVLSTLAINDTSTVNISACNEYKPDTLSNIFTNRTTANYIGIGASSDSIMLVDNVNFATKDLASFKTWLTTHPIQVCYILATPFTIQLTPQQIETLAGRNNLSTPLDGQSIETNGVEYKELFTFADVEKIVVPISMLGTDESGRTTASRAYTTGEFFYKDGKMYKVLTNIASGATFTVGTNISETTLFAELTALA